jgi:hypothetical protein
MRMPRRASRPCYDCGSIIRGEHSALCWFATSDSHRYPLVRLPPEFSTRGGIHPSGHTQHLTPEARAAQAARLEAAERLLQGY